MEHKDALLSQKKKEINLRIRFILWTIGFIAGVITNGWLMMWHE